MPDKQDDYLKEFNMNISTHGNRQSTNVSLLLQFIIGIVGTFAAIGLAYALKGVSFYFYAVIMERGPVQFVELFMAFMIASFLVQKSWVLRNQSRIITQGPVRYDVDLADDTGVQEMRDNILYDDKFGKSIVLDQMHHMLTLWLVCKDVARCSDWFEKEIDTAVSASEQTYAHVKVLIWAIPIMGFIGTVLGLGQSVSGFSSFLSGAADLGAIKTAIGAVTSGLGSAFDTTLLALVLSVLVMFPLSSVQRREELFFVDLQNYLQDSLLSRFPAQEKEAGQLVDLEAAIETGFRRYIPDPDRFDEVFTRSINELVTALQKQEENMRLTHKEAARDSVACFKELTAEMVRAAEELSQRHFETADALQKASASHTQQAMEASQRIGDRMAQVCELASGIQDMLKIQESVKSSVDGLRSAEEFGSLIKSLETHLRETDALCRKVSRPRVITFREETA
ncbi:MAG: hypothetical protein EOL87_05980 [Spartobacteria bacterium]|nr:hypothetical protein [Spartobacteria bacterium]